MMRKITVLCAAVLIVTLMALVLANEGRTAGNDLAELFKKEVGIWTIYATPKKICVMTSSLLFHEKNESRVIRVSISLGENYESFQIDIDGGDAPVRPDAIQKKVVMKIGKFSEDWKGVIARHSPEKAIFVFPFDIAILNQLSNDGVIQLKSAYSQFSFPFAALSDQIDTLVDCTKLVERGVGH